ncbi:Imm52 family immunity protein (plasmid) [Paraburkholderia strydomiana]
METYFAAAYWGPRRETVENCAVRAVTFLTALGQISEFFKEWRLQGRSRAEALRKRAIDEQSVDTLVSLFAKGRNKKDIGGGVIDELGYRASMWNGGDDRTASSLTMGCGMYSTIVGLSNAVVLQLPQQFDVQSEDGLRNVMSAFALAWEPDWAIVSSQSVRNRQVEQLPFLDRALYLDSKVTPPDDLKGSTLGEVLGHGMLFVQPFAAG